MQQSITKELLEQLGVTLPATNEDALLIKLNELLEERIGAEIASSLSDEQLAEMSAIQDGGDDEALEAWISSNVPELQDIAQDEFDILLDEVVKNEESILDI
jgi:hypothetical protein